MRARSSKCCHYRGSGHNLSGRAEGLLCHAASAACFFFDKLIDVYLIRKTSVWMGVMDPFTNMQIVFRIDHYESIARKVKAPRMLTPMGERFIFKLVRKNAST